LVLLEITAAVNFVEISVDAIKQALSMHRIQPDEVLLGHPVQVSTGGILEAFAGNGVDDVSDVVVGVEEVQDVG
jgi:hypothetical protein